MGEENELRSLLLFHSAILILKTMCMSLVTAYFRVKNQVITFRFFQNELVKKLFAQVIATPEDAFYMPNGKLLRDDPGVERARRQVCFGSEQI